MTSALVQSGNRPGLRALLGAMLCNAIEWYDFAIYGVLASYISKVFFSPDTTHTALLATFALLGVGFVTRPLGGLVIGYLSDVRGRKPALLLSIVIMAGGSLVIGLLPTYEQIGILAPMLLLIARLAQGISAGGEWGVAVAFLAEWSPQRARGFWCSFLAVSVAIGSLIASGVAAALITLLPSDDMLAWGWRIPFLLGGILGAIGFWLRVGVDETPIYTRSQSAGSGEGILSFRTNLMQGLIVFGITIHWTVCYYMFLIYMPSYTRVQGRLSAAESAWSNTIGLVTIILLVPLIGHLSDKYGRRPFLLTSCIAVAFLTAPAFLLIAESQSFVKIVGIQLVIGLTIALYSGPAPALLAELFSTSSRSRWSAVPYALGVTFFGGFAPFIADWLIRETGSLAAPTVYIVGSALVSFLVILRMRETAFVQLGSDPNRLGTQTLHD